MFFPNNTAGDPDLDHVVISSESNPTMHVCDPVLRALLVSLRYPMFSRSDRPEWAVERCIKTNGLSLDG